MNLEQQCISLNIAKRLKELGMKYPSLFCWTTDLDLEFLPSNVRNENSVIAAYTVTELGEILPHEIYDADDIKYLFRCYKFENSYAIDYIDEDNCCYSLFDGHNETLATAMGKTLIYLLEQGLIKL